MPLDSLRSRVVSFDAPSFALEVTVTAQIGLDLDEQPGAEQLGGVGRETLHHERVADVFLDTGHLESGVADFDDVHNLEHDAGGLPRLDVAAAESVGTLLEASGQVVKVVDVFVCTSRRFPLLIAPLYPIRRRMSTLLFELATPICGVNVRELGHDFVAS